MTTIQYKYPQCLPPFPLCNLGRLLRLSNSSFPSRLLVHPVSLAFNVARKRLICNEYLYCTHIHLILHLSSLVKLFSIHPELYCGRGPTSSVPFHGSLIGLIFAFDGYIKAPSSPVLFFHHCMSIAAILQLVYSIFILRILSKQSVDLIDRKVSELYMLYLKASKRVRSP